MTTPTPDEICEINACEYCSGNDQSVNGNDWGWKVHCACGASGPSKASSEAAIAAWNARASSRPADQVPDMVERVARALSIPQYHTGWDDLPETDKDLFYMQADYAIAALQAVPTSGEVGMRDQVLIAIAEHAVAGTFDQKQEAAGNVRRAIVALKASKGTGE